MGHLEILKSLKFFRIYMRHLHVKESYQSDNYTFTAVANDDNTYTVIVENEENGEVTKWTVDPSDGSRSMDS